MAKDRWKREKFDFESVNWNAFDEELRSPLWLVLIGKVLQVGVIVGLGFLCHAHPCRMAQGSNTHCGGSFYPLHTLGMEILAFATVSSNGNAVPVRSTKSID